MNKYKIEDISYEQWLKETLECCKNATEQVKRRVICLNEMRKRNNAGIAKLAKHLI